MNRVVMLILETAKLKIFSPPSMFRQGTKTARLRRR